MSNSTRQPKSEQRRKQLIANFADRESRAAYAEGFLHTWIASQFAAVRQQRGLTQKALAELTGTKQPGIARIEREDYGRWNLETLAKIAEALDCRLKVSLETYGSLIQEILDFQSSAYLLRPDFEHDPEIHAKYSGWPGLDSPGPVGMMRRKIAEWVERKAPVDELRGWLNGVGLPPAGEDTSPAQWVAKGLEGCPKEARTAADQRMWTLLHELRSKPETTWTRADRQLLEAIRLCPSPDSFEKPLLDVFESRREKAEFGDITSVNLIALIEATMHNQTPSHRCSHLWSFCIGQEKTPEKGVDLGLKGMALIPASPNAVEVVAHGLRQVQRVYLNRMQRNYQPFVVERLVKLDRGLGPAFKENLHHVVLAQDDTSEANLQAVWSYQDRVGFKMPTAYTQDTDFIVSEYLERLKAA